MPTQKLITTDNKTFVVDKMMIAKMSIVIGGMLRDLEQMDNEDKDDEPVPLDNIDGQTMELVLQWCTFHQHDPPPPDHTEGIWEIDTQDICPWDRQLLNVPKPLLYKIVCAANYLHIPGLVTLCCKTIANEGKGQSVDKLRKIFNIKNDFTPEREEKVRKDVQWTLLPSTR